MGWFLPLEQQWQWQIFVFVRGNANNTVHISYNARVIGAHRLRPRSRSAGHEQEGCSVRLGYERGKGVATQRV